MKSVLSTLRKIDYSVMSYLDDIFICGDTFEECRDAALATVNLLLKLGFSIHPKKISTDTSAENWISWVSHWFC